MPIHVSPGDTQGWRKLHDNASKSTKPRGPSPCSRVTVRKVDARSVPYGDSISRNGRTVWIALDGDRVVCVAATSKEARRKCVDMLWAEQSERAEQRRRDAMDGG